MTIGARLSPRRGSGSRTSTRVDTARVRVVVVPVLTPGIVAMTLGRWVLVRRGHESDVDADRARAGARRAVAPIHGVVGFLRAYLGDYVRGRRAGLGHWAAYRAIAFEAEARLRSGR